MWQVTAITAITAITTAMAITANVVSITAITASGANAEPFLMGLVAVFEVTEGQALIPIAVTVLPTQS